MPLNHQRSVRRAMLAGFLAGCSMLAASRSFAESPDPTRYVLFIHKGGGASGSEPAVKKTITLLASSGYNIRGIDDQQDTVGGAGIDYFNDESADAALEVAKLVNKGLGTSTIAPRRQTVDNPKEFIGVWLFSPPGQR